MQTINESDLCQFIGTEQYFRHPIARKVVWTDGINYLFNNGAAWLVDEIALAQMQPKVRNNQNLREFQLWTLKVTNKRGVLTLQEDSNRPNIIEKHFSTDFPLNEFHCYVEPLSETEMCILLTSEH